MGKIDIRVAKSEDMPAVKKLWQQVFNDTDEFIDKFYAAVPFEGSVFIACDSDKVVSLINSVSIRYGSSRGGYIYAGCTSPEYRNKGIYSKLIEMAQIGNSFTVLIPAETGLIAYYSKLGYRLLNNPVKVGKRVLPIDYNSLTLFDGDYNRLYDIYINNSAQYKSVFIRNYEFFKLAVSECSYYADVYYTESGYIICDIEEKKVVKIYENYCGKGTVSDIMRYRDFMVRANDESIPGIGEINVDLFLDL